MAYGLIATAVPATGHQRKLRDTSRGPESHETSAEALRQCLLRRDRICRHGDCESSCSPVSTVSVVQHVWVICARPRALAGTCSPQPASSSQRLCLHMARAAQSPNPHLAPREPPAPPASSRGRPAPAPATPGCVPGWAASLQLPSRPPTPSRLPAAAPSRCGAGSGPGWAGCTPGTPTARSRRGVTTRRYLHMIVQRWVRPLGPCGLECDARTA